jgi:SAM-dependent methyltransferase
MIGYLFKDNVGPILEIGGGYGNLANKIKKIFGNSKYVIVDLPEVLLTQHYYLSQNNPDYKILNLLDKDNIADFDLKNTDFDIALVPFSKHEMLNLNYDVVINTRSFGEMPKKVLENYFTWLQKHINESGIFYTTNRYVFTKSKDKNKIRDYPFDDFWDVVISQPQWLQTHLHEFLLQRRSKESKIPIKSLLRSFPITTPPPGPIMIEIQTQSDWLKHQRQ